LDRDSDANVAGPVGKGTEQWRQEVDGERGHGPVLACRVSRRTVRVGRPRAIRSCDHGPLDRCMWRANGKHAAELGKRLVPAVMACFLGNCRSFLVAQFAPRSSPRGTRPLMPSCKDGLFPRRSRNFRCSKNANGARHVPSAARTDR
jgi:hypothetical protein